MGRIVARIVNPNGSSRTMMDPMPAWGYSITYQNNDGSSTTVYYEFENKLRKEKLEVGAITTETKPMTKKEIEELKLTGARNRLLAVVRDLLFQIKTLTTMDVISPDPKTGQVDSWCDSIEQWVADIRLINAELKRLVPKDGK